MTALADESNAGQEPVCVYCRRRPVDPIWRPFCSERCKLFDLRNWVDERYRVAGDPGSSIPDGYELSDDQDSDSPGRDGAE